MTPIAMTEFSCRIEVVKEPEAEEDAEDSDNVATTEFTWSLLPVRFSTCSANSSRNSKPQRIAPSAPESPTVQQTLSRWLETKLHVSR